MSFNYANAMREEPKAIAWDPVVVDEAHKLRNAYRPSNKVGQGIRWATEDCRAHGVGRSAGTSLLPEAERVAGSRGL